MQHLCPRPQRTFVPSGAAAGGGGADGLVVVPVTSTHPSKESRVEVSRQPRAP